VSLHASQLQHFTNLEAVLHPRNKLAYFKNANWEPEWIEAAHKIVRDEFDRSYKTNGMANEGDEDAEDTPSQFSKVCLSHAVIYLLNNNVAEYF
jgi:hypothetical protein